jgi:hypothetical protein
MIERHEAEHGKDVSTTILTHLINRVSKSMLRKRIALCRDILEAFGQGRKPVMTEGMTQWSEMTLSNGTMVQIGSNVRLHIRSMNAKRETVHIQLNDMDFEREKPHPEDVAALTEAIERIVRCLEAGLTGNDHGAIKALVRDVTLTASREALARGMYSDRIGLSMPSPIGRKSATMAHRGFTEFEHLTTTMSLMDAMPQVVQIVNDYQDTLTIEPWPYHVTGRRWTAAHRAGPLPLAA